MSFSLSPPNRQWQLSVRKHGYQDWWKPSAGAHTSNHSAWEVVIFCCATSLRPPCTTWDSVTRLETHQECLAIPGRVTACTSKRLDSVLGWDWLAGFWLPNVNCDFPLNPVSTMMSQFSQSNLSSNQRTPINSIFYQIHKISIDVFLCTLTRKIYAWGRIVAARFIVFT